MSFGDRHLDNALDRWLTTDPNDVDDEHDAAINPVTRAADELHQHIANMTTELDERESDYQHLRDECASLRCRIDDKDDTMRSAIDELRRWQYSDDIDDIRHSIDMAIRTLQR